MKLELSALSIVSMIYLLLFGVASTDIALDSIEIGMSVSPSSCTITLHPVLTIWVPEITAYNHGGNAFAYGNVLVVGEHMRGGTHEEYVFNHERIHTQQFQALGWWIYPAQFVLPIEPAKGITTTWNDPEQPARIMWQPPEEWKPQWSFITLKFGEERT